jgi:hypothetical protein
VSKNDPVVRFPTATRCGVILSASPSVSARDWQAAVKAAAAALHDIIPEADSLGLIPVENDEEPALHALFRKLGRPIDGSLSLALPAESDAQRVLAAIPVIRKTLGDFIDPAGCVANVGRAMYAIKGYGDYAYTLLAFLDARIDQQQFIAWWAGHHSEMGLDSASSAIMKGYGVQLRYDALTSELNEGLGFSDQGDLFEMVYVNDVSDWRRLVTPEVLKGFCEDEKGFLAADDARVAMQRVIAKHLAPA